MKTKHSTNKKREMTHQELDMYLNTLPEPPISDFTPSEIKKIRKYLDAVGDDNEIDYRDRLGYIKKYIMYIRTHRPPRRETPGKIYSLEFVGMTTIYSKNKEYFSNRYDFIINGKPAVIDQPIKDVTGDTRLFLNINGVGDMYQNEEKLLKKYPEFRDYLIIPNRYRKTKTSRKVKR